MIKTEQNYVEFFTELLMVKSRTQVKVKDWDIPTALEMSRSIIVDPTEQKPYAFAFFTKAIDEETKESKVVARSGTCYINGIVKDISAIATGAAEDRGYAAILKDMKTNHWDKVVFIRTPYPFRYRPFRQGDVEVWDDQQ